MPTCLHLPSSPTGKSGPSHRYAAPLDYPRQKHPNIDSWFLHAAHQLQIHASSLSCALPVNLWCLLDVVPVHPQLKVSVSCDSVMFVPEFASGKISCKTRQRPCTKRYGKEYPGPIFGFHLHRSLFANTTYCSTSITCRVTPLSRNLSYFWILRTYSHHRHIYNTVRRLHRHVSSPPSRRAVLRLEVRRRQLRQHVD